MAERWPYRAVRIIESNGVRAYNPGDLVPAEAVQGPAAWLAIGDDVEPTGTIPVPQPAANASQSVWAAYAISLGMKPDQANGMSRGELIKATAPA